MTTTFKTKLSEAQKDVLDRAANRVRVRIIQQRVEENEAWNTTNLSHEHNGTLSALQTKGLILADDSLSVKGILTAKEIFNETCSPVEYYWDTYIAKAVAEKKEYEDKQEKERLEWKKIAEALPVPEGCELRDYGRLSVEWQPIQFAHFPSIKIEDKNAPYWGQERYRLPEWRLQCGGVGPMDMETVTLFETALRVGREILLSWEKEYANVEVNCLRHRFNAVTEGDAETAVMVCVHCGAEEAA